MSPARGWSPRRSGLVSPVAGRRSLLVSLVAARRSLLVSLVAVLFAGAVMPGSAWAHGRSRPPIAVTRDAEHNCSFWNPLPAG